MSPIPFSVTPNQRPGDWLGDLWHNLRAALPLLLLRYVPPARFVASAEQIPLLLALLALLYCALDAVLAQWPASLNLRALPAVLAGDFVLLLLLFVYLRATGNARLTVPLFVALESLWVWLTLLFIAMYFVALWLLRRPALNEALATTLLLYAYATSIVAVLRLLPGSFSRRLAASLIIHALLFACVTYFSEEDLWVADAVEEPAAEPLITEEAVLQAQSQALARELSALAPQRPQSDDLYAITFAGDAAENVFMHEVNAARKVFEQRLGAQHRVINLINNDRTVRDAPIATLSNLRAALRHIGAHIDRERDAVALYVTTHGSERHELSVSYEPLQLEQLDPAKLLQLFDEAGIKWRVIIVSACYAGGFVEPLKNDHSLIIAAADATHPSFGCGKDSDMTYFGRAYLEHALQHTRSLVEAFDRAKKEISERESAAGEEHSNPQIHVGAAMSAKLRELERVAREATAAATAPPSRQ